MPETLVHNVSDLEARWPIDVAIVSHCILTSSNRLSRLLRCFELSCSIISAYGIQKMHDTVRTRSIWCFFVDSPHKLLWECRVLQFLSSEASCDCTLRLRSITPLSYLLTWVHRILTASWRVPGRIITYSVGDNINGLLCRWIVCLPYFHRIHVTRYSRFSPWSLIYGMWWQIYSEMKVRWTLNASPHLPLIWYKCLSASPVRLYPHW